MHVSRLVLTLLLTTFLATGFAFSQNQSDRFYSNELGRQGARGVRTLYSLNEPTAGNDPVTRAIDYLNRNKKQFGRDKAQGVPVLSFSRLSVFPFGNVVRFETTIDGILVEDGEQVVSLSSDGNVIFYTGRISFPERADGEFWNIDQDRAISHAISEVGTNTITELPKASRIWHQEGERFHPAFKVQFDTTEPFGSWYVVVSAHNGTILQLENRMVNFHSSPLIADTTIRALVFDPDPLSVTGKLYGDPGFVDNEDADSAELDEALKEVTIAGVTFDGVDFVLQGEYVSIDEIGFPVNGANPLFKFSTPDFLFTRSNDAFEAVNAYYHLDNAFRYINEDLGIQATPQMMGRQTLRFDPHGRGSDDNSSYSPAGFSLLFGDGGVDDAEDADVVWHEFGHALHDILTNGGLSNNEGLGEGFSDYFAQSYSRSLGLFTESHPSYHDVFNWDGHNEFFNGRTTDYPYIYPIIVSDIYRDGQIFSTCFMRVQDDFGRETSDTIVLSGLSMLSRSSNQNDAAVAIFRAGQQVLTEPDWQQLHAIIASCGYTLPPIALNATFTTEIEKIAVGETALYVVDIHNDSTGDITNAVMEIPIPGGWQLIGGTSSCGGSMVGSTLVVELGNLPIGNGNSCSFELEPTETRESTTFFGDDVESGTLKWFTVNDLGVSNWRVDEVRSNTGLRSWFAKDVEVVSDQQLKFASSTLPLLGNPILQFYHRYDTEGLFDGGVVEISTDNGGSWQDLGPFFLINGYDVLIDNRYESPISDRMAFSGDSKGWKKSAADLSSFVGNTVLIRFRMATDRSVDAEGWWIDDIYLVDAYTIDLQACVSADGDIRICSTTQTLVNNTDDQSPEVDRNVLSLYPNPFNAVLHIETPAMRSVKELRVFDVLGRQIEHRTIFPGETVSKIDTSSWASGLYVVQFGDISKTVVRF